MLKSLVQNYPDLDISINVVWVPMLASDNEAAARKISSMFDDPRVHQYWDPQRRSGIAYTRSFPTMFGDMVASLPREHLLHPMLSKRVGVTAERSPMWDAAFFYDRTAEWSSGPPKPADWIKQVMFYGGRNDGVSGFFWLDDFATPPIDTDWWVELSKSMKKMTGAEPAGPQRKKARERKGAAATGASKPGKIDAKEAPASKPKVQGNTEVVSLADSLAPLEKRFNAATDKLRFVALLSPT